jgi:hypothetical protein
MARGLWVRCNPAALLSIAPCIGLAPSATGLTKDSGAESDCSPELIPALSSAGARLEPGVAEIHESLGRALAAQGKREEAAAHLEEAVRILKGRRPTP